MNTTVCKAWILPVEDGQFVAVGEFELVHIISDWTPYFHIPGTPAWCHYLFTWQNRTVPIFNIKKFLESGDIDETPNLIGSGDILSVIAYKNKSRQIEFGGFRHLQLPEAVKVNDQQICNYPDNPRWELLASSCFDDPNYGVVPVLDLSKIFDCEPHSPAENIELT